MKAISTGMFRRAMFRLFLIIMASFLGGCALESQCRDADEMKMAELYARTGTPPERFEAFADQCAKYSYRIPSKERFFQSYQGHTQLNCSSPAKYFQASYRIFELGRYPKGCANISGQAFRVDEVKKDAFSAHLMTKEIGELRKRIDEAHANNNQKKYDNGFILDALVRAATEDNPVTLEKKHAALVERRELVLTKYNLTASDLD